MFANLTKWGLIVSAAALLMGASVVGQSLPSVALGSDYLQTQTGTFFNFGGPIGIVDLMGRPIGPGSTDTIVQRQADAVINGNPIPIQIVALSMENTAPVNIGGSFFDVFVTLDPANLSRDVGNISVMGSLGGGTFNSFFDVFFDAHFVPIGGGQPFDIFNGITLSQSGASWSPTPPPSAVQVFGPFGDQYANTHTNLPSNFVDFWPCTSASGSVMPCVEMKAGGGGAHVVAPATPEPSTLFLLGPAGLGLLWRWRARRTS